MADEDLNRAIVRGVKRRKPTIDIVRVQDIGLRTEDDEVILDYAVASGRIILTHDAKTMPFHAYHRIEKGLSM
ncbi:MAG: DUF5615 family PIN-like protein, partial [Anaerolineales bacterium]|nr:DUF5615 family PIN-like protein [Anaerolineales bacterium]